MTFPSFVKDQDYKNLMTLMLDKNLAKRYCKFQQIQSHKWFSDFSWDDLISLDIKPAYLPKIPNKENSCRPRPYLPYIKSLKDWQPESDERPTAKNKADFENWWDKF